MKNIKILIVDDNDKDIKLLHDYLLSQECIVVIAKNEADVFKQLQEQNLDLVIMDIVMSDMSGWRICDKIKRDPLFKHIPVLMCSASIKEDDDFSKYETGDGYIQKPINFNRLVTAIQKLLIKN